MIIGFDARLMSVPGGLGRYCKELLTELAGQNPDDTFVVLVKKIPTQFAQTNIRWIETDIHWYGTDEQIKLASLMNRERAVQLWHIPHWNVPIFLRAPFIMTFHDFIFEEFPTYKKTIVGKISFKIKWIIWRILLAMSLYRARAVITVSDYVKEQVLRRNPDIAQKIQVIYNGLTHLPAAAQPSQEIQKPFFLMVGNAYPHKNHALILDLLATYPNISPTDWYLITHRDRFSEALQNKIISEGLQGRIHIMFDAPDTELSWMYQNCEALVFPSQSEGFGIPPLEAFSFGKPVIAARTSCLPEILGENAAWFESGNIHELAAAIERVKNDSEEKQNARKLCAQKYTWSEAALSTYFLYKENV